MNLTYLNAFQALNIQNQNLPLKAATQSFFSKPAINCHFFKKKAKALPVTPDLFSASGRILPLWMATDENLSVTGNFKLRSMGIPLAGYST